MMQCQMANGKERGLGNSNEALAEAAERLVLASRLWLKKRKSCTFTATLDLSAPMQGIIDEVWQAPVQIH